MSAFAGLAPEIKQALRSSTVALPAIVTTETIATAEVTTLDYGTSDEPDPALFAPAQRPAKRRRTEDLSDTDADEPSTKKLAVAATPSGVTSLVPFYASEDDVPAHLQKCAWSTLRRARAPT